MSSRDVATSPDLSRSPVKELVRFVHQPLSANQFDLAHQPVRQTTVTAAVVVAFISLSRADRVRLRFRPCWLRA